MGPCTVCGQPFPYARRCDQAHPGLCHACAELNGLPGGYDQQPHAAPPTLTSREHQAVAAYQRRVMALVDPQALARLLTEETP